jgi:hypothetical protein
LFLLSSSSIAQRTTKPNTNQPEIPKIAHFIIVKIGKEESGITKLFFLLLIHSSTATICWTASQFMSRDSEYVNEICNTCAKLCNACAEECEKH